MHVYVWESCKRVKSSFFKNMKGVKYMVAEVYLALGSGHTLQHIDYVYNVHLKPT